MMLEALLTIAALTPLACAACWRVGHARGYAAAKAERPNAEDYRNRAERAEAEAAELRANLHRLTARAKNGRFNGGKA